jgi:hypothetical protein
MIHTVRSASWEQSRNNFSMFPVIEIPTRNVSEGSSWSVLPVSP